MPIEVNETFISFITYSKHFTFILDLNDKNLLINPSLENFIHNKLGLTSQYSSTELLESLGLTLLHKGIVLEQLPLLELEHSCKDRNNEIYYLSWSIFPLETNKQLSGLIFVAEDITKLKELSFQKEQLDNIIKYAPDMIYWKDINSIHLGCNNQFATAAGFQNREGVIGKSDYDFPWREYAASYQQMDKEVIESGKPKLDVETTVTFTQGKPSTLITNKVPLRDFDGKIIGVLGIATDITERKNMEEALRKERATVEELERLNNIVQYAPGWIYWKDRNLTYLGCNDASAAAAGLQNRNEIIGKSDSELPWGAQATEYNLDDKAVIESGEPRLNMEYEVTLGKDQQAVVIASKVPLRNSKGEVIGVLGIATDITERKNIERDLQKAKIAAEAGNKAKSEFIANMSHDIRTPITGILGLIKELIELADEASASIQQPHSNPMVLLQKLIESVRENSQLALGSTDELLQLLNEILETTNLESGKAPEQAESFNFRELIEHNIEIMRPIARSKKLDLLCEIDQSIPDFVKGLRHYLNRTLLNLISNALKFTKKGFVKVSVPQLSQPDSSFRPGDPIELNIIIEDSGIGIPEDKFETIFEHFSRLTPSYQGLYKGAGLGLFTVKRYIEAMQAKISIESQVEKGSRFIIKLPLTVSGHSDREKISYRQPALKTLADKKANLRVLIVEDNFIAAKAAQLTLNRVHKECSCDRAETGLQAINLAQSNHYDLILMDIGLPDIDGLEATQQIRASHLPSQVEVPIIALTGHAGNRTMKEEALAAGIQAVFEKPLTEPVLESILREYVF